MNDGIEDIKRHKWFYEFRLPDGTTTESYLPAHIRPIHHTREKALRSFLGAYAGKPEFRTALDVSCHEGYYSLLLAEHFSQVIGIDKNEDSLAKARRMAAFLGIPRIRYVHSAIESWSEDGEADFVLCFGLLYHVENPVEIVRRIARATRRVICIESQVLPVSLQMQIENGDYLGQRESKGMFGLCIDHPSCKEGGLTELALVPSRDALVTLLEQFGFVNIRFYRPEPGDYEQFTRGHRVVLCAEKR